MTTSLPPNDIRWLFTYLRGPTASCNYNRMDSARFVLHQGVSQGSILSPFLFNYYVSSYPSSSELCTSYADDFTACVSDTSVDWAAAALAEHAGDVTGWAQGRSLIVSAQKSTITLFTPEFRQSHLHPTVPLNGTPLPLERHPKILGVTFDPHFFFHKHVEEISKKANPRLKILQLLTGTDWGQQKVTVLVTFKSLIRSLFTYAVPVWFPNTSQTSITRLQTIQNSALRIATGCVKMTPIDHLHTEAKTLKVEEHLNLLCSQFLATCMQPDHASFPIVTADSGLRKKTQSLQTAFSDQISDLLVDG
ncbi:MAG: reverse transcriptase domain-containing protein, partial [Bacteroidota bacterium]